MNCLFFIFCCLFDILSSIIDFDTEFISIIGQRSFSIHCIFNYLLRQRLYFFLFVYVSIWFQHFYPRLIFKSLDLLRQVCRSSVESSYFFFSFSYTLSQKFIGIILIVVISSLNERVWNVIDIPRRLNCPELERSGNS